MLRTAYHLELSGHTVDPKSPSLPPIEPILEWHDEQPLTLTFSDLAGYRTYGFAYRLQPSAFV
jgi:hypothetical protein